MLRWFVMLVVLASFCACAPIAQVKPFPPIAPRKGVQVSDIKLKDLDGRKVHLSTLKGKVVLLNFWATWCVTCAAEMRALQNLHDQLSSQGFTVAAVALDQDPAKLKRFAREHKLNIPLLYDAYGEAARAFSVYSIPLTYLLDRKGRFVYFSERSDQTETLSLSGPRNWDEPGTVMRILQFVQSM